eukprot:SAG22_NODE_484_length_9912_cov_23.425150_2_plen_77_part_00
MAAARAHHGGILLSGGKGRRGRRGARPGHGAPCTAASTSDGTPAAPPAAVANLKPARNTPYKSFQVNGSDRAVYTA